MRIVRRLAHALLLVLVLVVGATTAVVIVSQTSWFKNWLRGYIVRESGQYLNGTLSIGRLGGDLFFGLELEDVAVSMDGAPVVAIKDIGLEYSVFELISSGLAIDSIRLNQPVVNLRRDGEAWSIGRLIKKQEQEADREGPARPIAINAIGVTNGSVIVDGPVGTSGIAVPKRFEHLDAQLSFQYQPVRYTIEITHLSFRASEPELALNSLSGGLSVRNDTVYIERLAVRTAETSLSVDGAIEQYLSNPVVKMQLGSDKLSVPELARLVPALAGIELQPAFELKLDGPFDRLVVDMNVRSSAGQVAGNVVADLKAPQHSAAGTVSVTHLDLAPILKDPAQKSDITGEIRLDVRGPSFSNIDALSGTVAVNAPRIVAAGFAAEQVTATAQFEGRRLSVDGRASAYGSTVTTAGKLILPEETGAPVVFDLRGRTRGLDLRRLPRNLNVPQATTNINGEYRAKGSVTPGSERTARGQATVDLDADIRFAPSSISGASIAGGSTATVGWHDSAVAYRADATVANLDLERLGREFRAPALADERYRSSINGHIIADGRGTTPRDMNLTAAGTLHDTTIMDGRIPNLTFDAALQQDTLRIAANGSFEGFDPAVISGRPAINGAVAGTIDVNATIGEISTGITPDSVQGTVKAGLTPSTVGGIEITTATVDADYRHATADIRTFSLAGRDLNVTASGTLALDDSGESNLIVHADTPALDQIGKLFDQPLAGIAEADFTVTGNRRELQAVGTVNGGGVKYGENGALTLTSEFAAKLPQLDPANAVVSATTQGTFVTIAGQNINELAVKTDYANKEVTFDVTAKQPQRTLASAGVLIMHPDHQEVHLPRLSLTTQGMTWQTTPGSEATIQYGGGAVAVKNVTLVSGDQQIAANGSFGRPDDALNVTLTNVDVSVIDALMLRAPQLSGRLNATTTVTGTVSEPQVNAEFTIAQGGFRQFRYDSFAGTVSYAGDSIGLDTRLQQNPTAWIEAKGEVPVALFNESGWTSNQPVDLRIDSTPIDVGIVQGFTTALTGVTGTMEAHVHVAGTAAAPSPSGTVTVQDVAFTLEPNGVTYTDLDGRIELLSDRVHIDQIRVLDNHQSPLTITGDLALRERNVGEMTIAIAADDFKVIDNQLGNVRINSSLQLTGQLNAPRLEGDLGVTTGEINLDPILALFGNSAYSTEQIEYSSALEPNPVAPAPAAPSLIANLTQAIQVDVNLTIPNDLVVNADDLRAPGSPISLGDLNVTLGGDLYLHQVPYDRLRIYGAVNTVRGTYNFQGRRFTILRDGSLRFDGLDEINPSLDLRTERIIQAVTASVNVRGTLKEPEIVLSSVPPLEQADILSLIIFNQPVNQLGAGEQLSLAQRAQALATGAVAGQLASSIGNALGLDIFEISTAPDSGSAAELTIGQQVGQNLYVKIQQGIGDQSQTNFILEYELTDWLRLQTNVIQGSSTQQQLFQRMQGSGVNLLFFFSY